MRKILCTAGLAIGVFCAAGCSGDGDGKKSDPKPAEGQTIDPRIKPAETGSGGKPQSKGEPQVNKAQEATKGE